MRDLEADIILSLKSSCQYVTRDELSELCGMEPERVAEAMDGLRSRGYRIDEVPGEGYRFVSSPSVIDGCDIGTRLAGSLFGKEILTFKKVRSTNDVAISLARAGAREGTLVVSEEQSRGRGRLQRSWHSPPGVGLWFSVVLRPSIQSKDASTVSLAGALGVAVALRENYGVRAEIKWPNDIIVGRRKICGILTEGEFVEDRIDFVVLGVGLNVLNQEHDFTPEVRSIATSLKLESDREMTRAGVLTDVLIEIEKKYHTLCQSGFQGVRQELLAFSALTGRMIKVSTGKGAIEGSAVDIDDCGALIVRKENGSLERIMAGDVVSIV